MKQVRLFIAIRITDNELINKYLEFLENMSSHADIKLTERKYIHLTLYFIGDLKLDMIENLIHELDNISQEQKSFKLILNQPGFFKTGGKKGEKKIIWIGVERNEFLEKLYYKITNVLINRGIDVTNNNFKPHVTIGRVKNNFSLDIDKIGLPIGLNREVEVNSFELIKSNLFPSGPVYTIIKSFPLK